MADHETVLRLGVGALLAVLLHAGMLPAVRWSIAHESGTTRALPAELEGMLPEPDVQLGRPKPRRASVAWIAHDDFRRLIAPRAATEQPALQQTVEPTPNAPLPADPTPPDLTQRPQPPQPPQPSKPAPAAAEPLTEPTPVADASPIEAPPDGPSPIPPPTDVPPVAQAVESVSQAAPQPAAEARPTAAPRSRQDVSPTQLALPSDKVRPGSVIVGDGVEITTARPRFALSALMTAVPNNTRVRVLFNHNGEVVQAQLLGTTGYADFDGPILESLYRWRASGPKVREHVGPLEVRLGYLIRPELGRKTPSGTVPEEDATKQDNTTQDEARDQHEGGDEGGDARGDKGGDESGPPAERTGD